MNKLSLVQGRINPHPGHVVASLDKTPYDNYLCVAASNKQQICVGRSQSESLEYGQHLSEWGQFVLNKNATVATS